MGMDGETKLAAAMAMAGRVARACDVCGKERARWYCAADEAYLCEHCDSNVHNANPLSRRHERVRLAPNGAPMKIDRRSTDTSTRSRKAEQTQPPDADSPAAVTATPTAPAPGTTRHHRHGTWQRGYSKKRSRSGRRRTHSLAHLAAAAQPAAPAQLFVDPDRKNVKQEPGSPAHADSQAVHEVPTFLPDDYLELPIVSMSNDICFNDVHPLSWLNADDASAAADALDFLVPDGNLQGQGFEDTSECLHSELDAGMDALMDDGTLMLNEISGMTGIGNLGMLDLCPDRDDLTLDFSDIGALNCASTEAETPPSNTVQAASPFRLFARLKTEFADYDHREYDQEQQHGLEHDHEQQQEQMQQYEQQEPHHLYGDIQVPKVELSDILGCSLDEIRTDEKWSGPSLKLNYEDVLNAWSERGMSWADSRCQAVPADSNPDSTVSTDVGIVPDLGSSVHQCSEAAMGVADDGCTGGGREARVMRYREKRRTRLFSKKIRYEVRKLNAERRPRMKGRFVKRTGL